MTHNGCVAGNHDRAANNIASHEINNYIAADSIGRIDRNGA